MLAKRFAPLTEFRAPERAGYRLLPFRFIALDGERSVMTNMAGEYLVLDRAIVRDLQFVNKAALMGLEITGFTKANLSELWIDPTEYQSQLKEAATVLTRGRVATAIYNHQLCVLDRTLWPLAVRSISDWKNEYMPECEGCSMMYQCGGFFSSARIKRSAHISPIIRQGT